MNDKSDSGEQWCLDCTRGSFGNAIAVGSVSPSGNLNINWNTTFRADMMPYGGLKDSGLGKEGPHYAIDEMTELKMVIFH